MWKRFTVLNDLLKGHRPGELTIFSGQTGTGKTTFLSEYSLDLCIQGALENAASAYRIQHLVVDNLQYMMNMEEYNTTLDQFRRQEQIFGYLREFANRRKCHVTLVIHPRKEPEFTELNNTSISGTAKAIQEADNILILQTTKTRQYLQVSKNRYDGDKGCVIVEFDKKSLTFNMKQVNEVKRSTEKHEMYTTEAQCNASEEQNEH
ncbi:twinkle protein, mitochondrial [Trichonephila clavipes]|nr:twinkle protein, mitochondrial [Trichonephila clavipes]